MTRKTPIVLTGELRENALQFQEATRTFLSQLNALCDRPEWTCLAQPLDNGLPAHTLLSVKLRHDASGFVLSGEHKNRVDTGHQKIATHNAQDDILTLGTTWMNAFLTHVPWGCLLAATGMDFVWLRAHEAPAMAFVGFHRGRMPKEGNTEVHLNKDGATWTNGRWVPRDRHILVANTYGKPENEANILWTVVAPLYGLAQHKHPDGRFFNRERYSDVRGFGFGEGHESLPFSDRQTALAVLMVSCGVIPTVNNLSTLTSPQETARHMPPLWKERHGQWRRTKAPSAAEVARAMALIRRKVDIPETD